ncbi:beta-lactamase family protein [Cavenderia fasciculata]|uniref:Beta-lactamase family protein n=1 Tax=Cavenderia fasciculata TaxID=261658 RepID=F4Q146_CACFS|nr:beta-lactamase family protein [Cavenderia fasciculata]EGG18547.1 beta-lactamase family protein [Cavenderia fasciculata]|eukprot:XP_004366451.1 beta-lactamase family protein [Cavenderia fasciculata]
MTYDLAFQIIFIKIFPLSLFMKLIFILLIIKYVSIGCPDYPQPVPLDQNDPTLQKAYAEVDAMIQANMKTYGVQSFVATIVYGDDLVWSKAYGKVDPLNPQSPDLTIDNTVRIASITKTFTDLMMFQLRDKGVIALDDPISKYYPNFSIRDSYHTKRDITFRELASHQSGLPREVPCNFDLLPTDNCTESIILERLQEHFLILPQYTTTHYSNLGMALLGRACGKAAHMEYEQYVEEKILAPLGMHNSSFDYNKIKDRMAIGLELWPNGTYLHAPIIGLGWGTPMGGLFATARDMARYASFWLSNESPVLDSSTVKEALSAIYLVNDGQSAYGTPWETFYNQNNNIWVREKAGALDGYRSQLAVIRELKLGVFFSSMMYLGLQDLWMSQALDILIPVYEAMLYEKNSTPQLFETIPTSFKKAPTPIPQSALHGVYEYEGSLFVVQDDTNGNLIANFGGAPNFNMTLFAQDHPHIYRIKIADPSIQSCIFVDDGSNYELVYVKYTDGASHPESMEVMGQTMPWVSENPSDAQLFEKVKPIRPTNYMRL